MKRYDRLSIKAVLFCLLGLAMLLGYPMQASASENQSMVMINRYTEEEIQQSKLTSAASDARDMYQLLVDSDLGAQTVEKLSDLGTDIDEFTDTVPGSMLENAAKAFTNDLIDAVGDDAEYGISHIWKGDRIKYWKTKLRRENISKGADVLSAASNIKDICNLAYDDLHLQSDSAGRQILEVMILTAQFALAAFSLIGMSVSFPLSIVLAVLLNLLLDLTRGTVTIDDVINDFADLFSALHLKLQDITNVYKPNIYIYSREPREVTVSFDHPERLTAVIPDYSGRWTVTADADGQLTDAGGLTFGYLFYESVTDPSLFQTKEGWRIPAASRLECFERILKDLDFSDREIADFTEFWVDKLDAGKDYIMYPQEKSIVDLAMPIRITEEPAALERIWFAFAEDHGSAVTAPAGCALTRGGQDCPYYIVEWGGLILP